MKLKIFFCIFAMFIILSLNSETIFRIMSYNSLRFPDASGAERKQYFRKIFNYAHPDILLMQEVGSVAGADTLLSILNSIQNKYQRADFMDDGAMNSILFYNANIVELLSQDQINANPRKINEYEVSVLGNQLYCYSGHLRASTGEDNEQERLAAVTAIRNHIGQLPEGTEFIIVGDMNFYSSSEPGYQKFIDDEENNIGRCRDLCPLIGDWHDNEEFSSVHTQSPRVEFFEGGIGGGLDDKFDFIFTSYDMNNQQNIEYVEDSFVTVGNDGNHFNQSVNDGENTAVPPDIADALYYASDHLPVFADFSVDEDFLGLISPNGGENWFSGQTQSIVWESSLSNVTITINLTKANPYQVIPLAQNIENSGSWNWEIPQDIQPGDDYKIQITSSNNYTDESSNFFNINVAQQQNIAFISEYVEGSSYNKALEIFNPCDYEIDLTGFNLKKQTNGSGEFGSEFDLTGQLASHDVIVIAHPSACEEILQVADYTVSGVCNFNGNDAVALFKDDQLIDLLGIIDSDEYWGKDKTLVRKPYISNPNSVYNPAEWTEYPIDTFSYLGYHLYDPSFTNNTILPIMSPKILIYPNPVRLSSKSTTIGFLTPDSFLLNGKISLYNLKGECLISNQEIENNQINIHKNIIKNSGIYLFQIRDKSGSYTGKFVIIK